MSEAAAVLHAYSVRLSAQEREAVFEGLPAPRGTEIRLSRKGDDTVSLYVIDDLMREFERLRDAGIWADRAESDRWLAPRVHYALRLSRAEAADRGVWLWLALRYDGYVRWRWDGVKSVTEDRWYGPVHKQALARLWWGGEIFRNGADYTPVVRAFVRQDLPNSYLHRPLVRCRSLALGILDVIAPSGRETEISATEVNNLAAMLNLSTAGAPPEAETDFAQDDLTSLRAWAITTPTVPTTWDDLPDGPACTDTSPGSLAGGKAIADRAWTYAGKYRQGTKDQLT